MKFQHLVQINDPLNPLIDPLTREQVWHGLVLKAENPLLFVPTLDSFKLLARHADWIERELRFGSQVVRDRVSFQPMDQLRQETEATGEIPAATLVTSIEAPDEWQLFVRFDYSSHPPNGAPPVDPLYQGFIQQAYVEADTDAIRTIRRLAVEGRL